MGLGGKSPKLTIGVCGVMGNWLMLLTSDGALVIVRLIGGCGGAASSIIIHILLASWERSGSW